MFQEDQKHCLHFPLSVVWEPCDDELVERPVVERRLRQLRRIHRSGPSRPLVEDGEFVCGVR